MNIGPRWGITLSKVKKKPNLKYISAYSYNIYSTWCLVEVSENIILKCTDFDLESFYAYQIK